MRVSIRSRSAPTSTLRSATSVRRCATPDSSRAIRASMGLSGEVDPTANSMPRTQAHVQRWCAQLRRGRCARATRVSGRHAAARAKCGVTFCDRLLFQSLCTGTNRRKVMLEALLLAAGLATGGAIGFAIAWTRGAPAREELAAVTARAEEQERAAADKLAHVTNMRRELADAFKALSAQALDSTSATFLKLAKAELGQFQERAQSDLKQRQQAVDALVQPIKESLTKVDGKIGEIERARIDAYSSLNQQLRSLVETHLPRIQNATVTLANAMRQPTVRGRWGELQLKRVVEVAGMLEHCDFVEQPTGMSDDARQRPDAIVTLPGGAQIIIDAKVPFAAYLDAHDA